MPGKAYLEQPRVFLLSQTSVAAGLKTMHQHIVCAIILHGSLKHITNEVTQKLSWLLYCFGGEGLGLVCFESRKPLVPSQRNVTVIWFDSFMAVG